MKLVLIILHLVDKSYKIFVEFFVILMVVAKYLYTYQPNFIP